MKINELVVHESKLYYLEQLYLEEGFASGLGNVADAIGKGVSSLPGLIAGAGNKFAQGFGRGYHDTKSAVIGQPSQPKTARDLKRLAADIIKGGKQRFRFGGGMRTGLHRKN